MALVTRIARLFRADIHAVLDRIEQPDLLLRQAVREMEGLLVGDERQLRLLLEERGQTEKRLCGVEQDLATTREELDVCFRAENEVLARSLVRRRIEQQRIEAELERQLRALSDAIDAVRERLARQRGQLDAMRRKMAILVPGDGHEGSPHTCATPAIRDEEVEIAFLQEKERRCAP